MVDGTITRINLNKGYCFVRGIDGLSRFAHASSFTPASVFDTLREGQPVYFDSVQGKTDKGSGLRAINIRLVH
jgi:cold shock CspA family protein